MRLVLADLAHGSLKPVTETRSVADIEVGGGRLQEHIERVLEPEETTVLTPEHLEEVTEMNSELFDLNRNVNELPEEYVLYNTCVMPSDKIRGEIQDLERGEGIFHEGLFVAGKTEGGRTLGEARREVEKLERKELGEEPLELRYPWHLVEANPALLEDSFPGARVEGEISEDAVVKGSRENLYVGEEAEIGPGTVIDVRNGPVQIDQGSEVSPNSRIEGPAYIGSKTQVGSGQNAVIHEGTHVGDVCRVGGEVEEAVVHSFTNKYHYGFLGHAVVGSWVNIGAGTTNSDLKNTYGKVRVSHPEEGEIEAGKKVGMMVGDHVKFGIASSIHTGKVIETCCFVTGTVDRDLGPFTWFDDGDEHDYITSKALKHVKRMMGHREDHLPEGYREAHRKLLEDIQR